MDSNATLRIKKILLPVDYPLASLVVIHQAAAMARHFDAQIVLLHAATPRSHAAGVPVNTHEMRGWDLLAAVVEQAERQGDATLAPQLAGLAIRHQVVEGDAATAIVQTAHDESADLIMMPSHSFTFSRFLLGSVTAKVLQGTECPVWTDAHRNELPVQEFAVRNVLCAVDFGPRAALTVSWAARFAAGFGARLTLANVTAGVELWGPGGSLVDRTWKDDLVGNATLQMAKLQREMGTHAEVFIGSGDVPKVLSQAALQTNADLLVTGCYPYGGHLRTHGYGIICAVQIPVLSV